MKIENLIDKQIKTKESRLRDWLVKLDNRSDLYAKLYETWFYLREVGIARGTFKTFVPLVKHKTRLTI